MRTLCAEIKGALSRHYYDGGPCPESLRIIDLDSSTEKKFSRHLVVRLPDAAFADNLHCGRFVHALCSDLAAEREPKVTVASSVSFEGKVWE